jgi:hypothetical protein
VTVDRRYFITSHPGSDAPSMANAVRSHWGVENGHHWCLDVAMNEDQCRLRPFACAQGVGHGAENFSRLRRIAPNTLKRWQITKANGKGLEPQVPAGSALGLNAISLAAAPVVRK